MLFGLFNAPATFQSCMMEIFSNFVENVIEIFMDDFSVCGSSFDHYLQNLSTMFEKCKAENLVPN